jgi:hypothetical protein
MMTRKMRLLQPEVVENADKVLKWLFLSRTALQGKVWEEQWRL